MNLAKKHWLPAIAVLVPVMAFSLYRQTIDRRSGSDRTEEQPLAEQARGESQLSAHISSLAPRIVTFAVATNSAQARLDAPAIAGAFQGMGVEEVEVDRRYPGILKLRITEPVRLSAISERLGTIGITLREDQTVLRGGLRAFVSGIVYVPGMT
jgi:hypothetical protein